MTNTTKEIELPLPSIFKTELECETNNKDIGSSFLVCEMDMGGRKLTDGEIALVEPLFGDAINYDKVRIHKHHAPGYSSQFKDAAITPNGHLYFIENPEGKTGYMEDFSKPRKFDNPAAMHNKQWFIHEMVHVWQFQLRFKLDTFGNKLVAISPWGRDYTLTPDKRLNDYNMEQQGNILTDYWMATRGKRPDYLYEKQYRNNPKFLPLVTQVIADFLINPKNPAHLPK